MNLPKHATRQSDEVNQVSQRGLKTMAARGAAHGAAPVLTANIAIEVDAVKAAVAAQFAAVAVASITPSA